MRLIDSELQTLRAKLLDMADLVVAQLTHVIEAIQTLDYGFAKSIRKRDKKVNKIDTQIDKRCEKIIVLHQPVASDLRYIFSVLKINSFLEQIGDLIIGIARKVKEISQPFESKLLEDLEFAEIMLLSKNLLSISLTSYFKKESDLLKTVFAKDDEIDRIHRNALSLIVSAIQRSPSRTDEFIQLLFIIKSIEKIADFAVCIAEEALFSIEGVVYKHSKRKQTLKAAETN